MGGSGTSPGETIAPPMPMPATGCGGSGATPCVFERGGQRLADGKERQQRCKRLLPSGERRAALGLALCRLSSTTSDSLWR